MSCCPPCPPKEKCYNIRVKCKCCHKKEKYKVCIPTRVVAAVAYLYQDQEYSTEPSNVFFNYVTVNESPSSSSKKKKPCKKKCSMKECSTQEESSCSEAPYPVAPKQGCPNHEASPEVAPKCEEKCGCEDPSQACGCDCFYNPMTGVATVPRHGSGHYAIVVKLATNSSTASTAQIRIDGTPVEEGIFGYESGNTNLSLMTFVDLREGHQISVTVENTSGEASLIASEVVSLHIAKLW